MPTQLSQLLLYINAGLSALTVLGHTKMGYDVVFPSLQRGSSGGAKGKGKEGILDNGAKAARIGWLEVNQGFVVMSIFCIKWARLGLADNYDRALMAFMGTSQLYFGCLYAKEKMYEPLAVLWGMPALLALSQVV